MTGQNTPVSYVAVLQTFHYVYRSSEIYVSFLSSDHV